MGRIVLHRFHADYTPDEGEIDPRRLQGAFARLMDRGAEAVQRGGHDLDDVIFERFGLMRYAGDERTLTIPIDFLTKADLLVAPFHAAAKTRAPGARPNRRVEIVGLTVEVVADPDAPVGGQKWR